ncbi:MAG: malonyl-CoA decarboxylase [Rhodospirillales bacterium]|nr:malonyl-CoA decarboxylase [Rhodospirillales bacterium]
METVEESTIERAWSNLARGFRDIAAGAARTLGLSARSLSLTGPALKEAMAGCLDARGGDVSARLKAAELGQAYSHADAAGRRAFLETLVQEFDAEPAGIASAIEAWQKADEGARAAEQAALRAALRPPWERLMTQFLSLPAGVKFLVDMRADLLTYARQNAALKVLDRDLRALLESWFDVGFLDVRRLSWNSPAALLEKIVHYEAVHEIRSWSDLRNRLESDRRLYGLFHPRMPDEPLAFVEVALTEGLAGNVQVLLDETAPLVDASAGDSAIFYSISNTQKGLAGIAFGEWLIKKVVSRLREELPNLKTFATLSPLPGFAGWLTLQQAALLIRMTPEAERKKLQGAVISARSFPRALQTALETANWTGDETLSEALQPILRRLCLRYLLDRRADGQSLDPVARFHLRNGARLERINWRADLSANGLTIAHGLMVNYLYDLSTADANRENYARQGKVTLGSDLKSLARQVTGPRIPALPSIVGH